MFKKLEEKKVNITTDQIIRDGRHLKDLDAEALISLKNDRSMVSSTFSLIMSEYNRRLVGEI